MKQTMPPAVPEAYRLPVLIGFWIFLLLVTVIPADAAQVTLAWNPSTSPQLSGYRVRRGTSSGNYDSVFDVGNVLKFTDRNAVAGTTYFYAVSAIDANGSESRLSRELKVVASSNKRPTISAVADRTVPSGGRIQGIRFNVGDSETEPAGLVVTASSSRPDLIPPELIQITGTGSERSATIQTTGSDQGTATIQLTVNDGELTSKTQFQINLLAARGRVPQAISRSVSVAEDSSVTIRLTGSGNGPNALTFQVLNPPEFGRLSGIGPDLVYTPHPNQNGPDRFTYVVSDGELTSTPGIISVDVQPVNDAPKGETDRITILPGAETSLLTSGQASVLANDYDADEDLLQAQLIDRPKYGVLELEADGTFVYRHNRSEETTDRFTYRQKDAETTGEPTEVRISIFRVKAQYSSENTLILEWPSQLGNQYVVESTAANGAEEGEALVIASMAADEDKSLSVQIPPDALIDRVLWVRCITESGELTAEVKLPAPTE